MFVWHVEYQFYSKARKGIAGYNAAVRYGHANFPTGQFTRWVQRRHKLPESATVSIRSRRNIRIEDFEAHSVQVDFTTAIKR